MGLAHLGILDRDYVGLNVLYLGIVVMVQWSVWGMVVVGLGLYHMPPLTWTRPCQCQTDTPLDALLRHQHQLDGCCGFSSGPKVVQTQLVMLINRSSPVFRYGMSVLGVLLVG